MRSIAALCLATGVMAYSLDGSIMASILVAMTPIISAVGGKLLQIIKINDRVDLDDLGPRAYHRARFNAVAIPTIVMPALALATLKLI